MISLAPRARLTACDITLSQEVLKKWMRATVRVRLMPRLQSPAGSKIMVRKVLHPVPINGFQVSLAPIVRQIGCHFIFRTGQIHFLNWKRGRDPAIPLSPAAKPPPKESFMPLIDIQLIEGVFTPEQKKTMIEKVTEAMVAIEGEAMRHVTWVRVQETGSGEWAIGGKPLTAAAVRAMATAR
jgi:4-oxalocrotonate tautomerase